MSKQILKALLFSSTIIGLGAAAAASDPTLAEKMRVCFEKHHRMMDKPAVTNPRDCYRVHGYRMDD